MKCENLDVWKRSATLSSELYLYFRESKDYGFKDQITRSGLSIPSNIAEGVERNSDKESIHFLDIAQGSCAELKTQIYIGMKIAYIDKETGKKWIDEVAAVNRMIGGLKKSIISQLAT
ncbi:four helix bundle protein [Nitratifractor salsuginis]|uniref:S23 ribosomal protein n=1 Tax=Nitratifractor salsuginis (strain DSM 16511 / JCM 12458 / E9I37-1) TaxID=749222 RepID=E6X1E5_NITSE|nr:four helix bundle protein [Nitratifractor salsuginis]ADV45878.1 S23 ribosomal protein [Nitratifractor salsuginis DSM 16511]